MNEVFGKNRLADERSPYLLQHKNNPVWWWPWCDEAFEAARAQNKPVFLSIGYSTCYWCHVMERDSFEKQDVADFLNQHFIAIKLDREERPDIDSIYMDAVIGMSGQGGWPMSVFMTADRQPFWGGTFFERSKFLGILNGIARGWNEEREKIEKSGRDITEALRAQRVFPETAGTATEAVQQVALSELADRFDAVNGGFGTAPKFPPSGPVANLLAIGHLYENPQAMGMALKTLEGMMRGGIYDQLGGGFSRYSTDERWLVPHFEKMLYDNALILLNLIDALRTNFWPGADQVVRETLAYLERDMLSPEGAFCAAEDAGAVGAEGAYYVWKDAEIREVLNPEEYAAFAPAYGVSAQGNFEGGQTVLALNWSIELAQRKKPLLAEARRKLAERRQERVGPHLDDKILTSWNGLAIAAFAECALYFNSPHYLALAVQAAECITGKLWNGKELQRRLRQGDARFPATLEDYSYLIFGLLKLAQASSDEQWLLIARKLQRVQDAGFWSEESRAYVLTRSADAITQKVEILDGATPSPNALAWYNLHRLNRYFGAEDLAGRAAALERTLRGVAENYTSGMGWFLTLVEAQRGVELVVVGDAEDPAVMAVTEQVGRGYYPSLIFHRFNGGSSNVPLFDGKNRSGNEACFYWCVDRRCEAPTSDADSIIERLTKSPRL